VNPAVTTRRHKELIGFALPETATTGDRSKDGPRPLAGQMENAMYSYEREALGIESMGEARGGVTITGQVDISSDASTAWWIASLYAPRIWDTWHVGLVRRSLKVMASSPVSLPSPLEFKHPADSGQPGETPGSLPHRILVCPALVKEKALGFVIRDPDAPPNGGLAEIGLQLLLLAPTDLVARLGLSDGGPIALRVLPAQSYRPERRPEKQAQ